MEVNVLRVRKRWVSPPGWPRPPRGFAPAADWQPSLEWPAPPVNWRFWRVPRLRLTSAVLLIAFAAILWPGAVGNLHALNQHRAIDKRGLTTTAAVLSYSYDPDGGDPDGWTTDRVRFTTASGETVVTTVGHHSAGPERTSRTMAVSYDPQHPAVARASAYEDDAADPANVVVGVVLSLLISAAGIYLATTVVTTPRREQGGRPQPAQVTAPPH